MSLGLSMLTELVYRSWLENSNTKGAFGIVLTIRMVSIRPPCRRRQRETLHPSAPTFALCLLINAIVLLSTIVSANSVQRTTNAIQVLWREDPPPTTKDLDEEDTDNTSKKAPRKRISFSSEMNQQTKQSIHQADPHKMRTDLWTLNMHWKRKPATFLSNSTVPGKELALEFADNGFVRERSQHSEEVFALGKWTVSASGVSWDLAIGDQKFLFRGILLLNPFGSHPKIVQGVVLDDSRSTPWFRPVVATFSGKGVGQDTADLSYKKRK